MGRGRRSERRHDHGPGVSGDSHFQMREKLASFGDDFWIEKGGQKVYKVDGKVARVRDTLNFVDHSGNLLCKIQEKKVRVKDSIEVEGPVGEQMAVIKKAIVSPVRDRHTVKMKNGKDLEVKGSILDHEYTIGEGRDKVAEISKKWFRVRDSYGVDIEQGQDEIVILAATVCIDQMA